MLKNVVSFKYIQRYEKILKKQVFYYFTFCNLHFVKSITHLINGYTAAIAIDAYPNKNNNSSLSNFIFVLVLVTQIMLVLV